MIDGVFKCALHIEESPRGRDVHRTLCHDPLGTKERTVVKLGTPEAHGIGWHVSAALSCALVFVACSANSAHEGNKGDIQKGPPAPTPELPACVLFCHDADGDAWGGGRTVSGGCEDEAAVPQSGFAVCFNDCDDTDASVYAWAAPDADGDGFAPVGSAPACIGPLPEGQRYGALPGDCNDENPSVSPGVPEQWLDGVDSDCNGEEDPNDCSADEFDSSTSEVDPNCADLPDLFVVRTFGCLPMCGSETPYVVLGNRGGGRIDGRVTLISTSDYSGDHGTTVSLTLDPGEHSNPLALPSTGIIGRFDFRVELESAAPECDLSNNTGQSGVGVSDCF